MIQKLILLAIVGALGTVARFGLATLFQKVYGPNSIWGTLAVNLIGCFIAGLVWSLFEYRWPAAAETRLLVMIGFLGAFTTFSAIMVESGELARSATWLHAMGNIMVNNALGIVALLAGTALGAAGLQQ